MHPKDIVFRYCKFQHIKQLGYNLKKDILKELSVFLRSSTNKDLIEKLFSKKISYNNIFFFEEMGFKITFKYIEESDSYQLILKNSIEMPPINIKKQTYFHYKFVNQLMTINKKHKFLSKLFDELGFLDESIYKIEYESEPYFKMNNKIYIKDNEYISIEFFEKNKINKYTGILSEKLRMANELIFNKEDKCHRFYVYWEHFLMDEKYFENYVNNIAIFIEDLTESHLEYFNKKFNRNMKDYANAIISNNSFLLEDLNKLIEWKDEESQARFYVYYKRSLTDIGQIDKFQEGILSLSELNYYIKKLDTNYVKDEHTLEYWSNINFNILNEYKNSYIDFINKRELIKENPIYGLE